MSAALIFKIVIVLLLLVILASLTSGMVFLVKDKGKTNRTLNSLTVRIALSVRCLFCSSSDTRQAGFNRMEYSRIRQKRVRRKEKITRDVSFSRQAPRQDTVRLVYLNHYTMTARMPSIESINHILLKSAATFPLNELPA